MPLAVPTTGRARRVQSASRQSHRQRRPSPTRADDASGARHLGVAGIQKLAGIDSGDIIAMKLKSGGHTYWAFANANETAHGDHVGHVWNYGLNTWGWERDYKGGGRDFNDLVVQLDFTSAYGHGWLV